MKFRFAILLITLAVLLSACSLSLAEDITPPPDYKTPTPAPTVGAIFPANPPDLASGAAIYAEKCAPCHGATGLADGAMAAQLPKPAPAFGKPEVARAGIPANWFATVTQGKIDALMPPFNSLSEQERWNVVMYAMSLGTTAAEIEQGQAVYAASCAQCHGADGKMIAKSDFTDQKMMSKLTQNDIVQFTSKGIGDMPALGTTLSEADMYAAAAYIRTLTFAPAQASAPAVTPQPASPSTDGTPSADATPSTDLTATPIAVTGTVSGVIANGSGGAVPADLKVSLHIFAHDTTTQQFSEMDTKETSANAQGAYTFTNLTLPEGNAFYVATDYAGTTYESEAAFVEAGKPLVFELPLTIYETTTDTSALVIDQAHILFDYSKADIIQVVEFYVISNSGNKAVVAAEENGPVVKISLPKGASNLQIDQGALGERFIQTADGFADTVSVPPTDPASQSNYSLVFAFDLPAPQSTLPFDLFGGPKLEMTQPFSLSASAISVLVPEGIKANDPSFTDGGLQKMGENTQFQLYKVDGRKAGESLTITISGKPAQAASAPVAGTDSSKNIIIGVGVFGLALILIGAWLYWRDRRSANEEDLGDDEDENADPGDTEEIVDAIIALDEQYKAGNITEEAYKERRAELKAKLKSAL